MIFLFLKNKPIEATQIKKSNTTVESEKSKYAYFWQYNPNQKITDNPEWLKHEVTYSINNDGLNSIIDFSIEKPPNTKRILTLGDSYTFGHFVNTQENWPTKIQTLIQNYYNDNCPDESIEVINLGMPGFDVAYIIERYKLKGDKYNPDLIVWFDPGTALTRFNEKMHPFINECYENKTYLETKFTTLNEHYFCWDYGSQKVIETYSIDNLLKDLATELSTFLNLTEDIPKEFVFFGWHYNENKTNLRKVFYPNDFFDISQPSIIWEYDKSHQLEDGHASELGNSVLAEKIFKNLSSKYDLCEL